MWGVDENVVKVNVFYPFWREFTKPSNSFVGNLMKRSFLVRFLKIDQFQNTQRLFRLKTVIATQSFWRARSKRESEQKGVKWFYFF